MRRLGRQATAYMLVVVLALTPLTSAFASGYLPNYDGLEPRDRDMFKAVNDRDAEGVAVVLKHTLRDLERVREALRPKSNQELYRLLKESGLQEIGPVVSSVVQEGVEAEPPNDAVVAHVLIERGFPMARGDLGGGLFLKDEAYGPILLDAARRGDAQLVEEVLSKGVRVNPCTATGVTAADVAVASGYPKTAERFRGIGGE